MELGPDRLRRRGRRSALGGTKTPDHALAGGGGATSGRGRANAPGAPGCRALQGPLLVGRPTQGSSWPVAPASRPAWAQSSVRRGPFGALPQKPRRVQIAVPTQPHGRPFGSWIRFQVLEPRGLAEYALREISYEVKAPTCHELRVLARPDDPIAFHFDDEHEAQRWWAALSSSLREAHRAPEGSHVVTGRSPTHLSAATNSLPVGEPEASPSLEMARKDLAFQLSTAIALGDQEGAAQCATVLAQQQVPLRILPKESCYPASEISMKVGVEDATCSANITIPVHTYTTIAALRQKVFHDYGFHPSVQRWIIGQCLCVDDQTVGSYGIRKDGDTAFLYLLTAKVANLSEQRYREDKNWMVLQPAPSSLSEGSSTGRPASSPLPKTGVSRGGKETDIEERLSALQLTNLLPGQPHTPAAANVAPPSPVQAGWPCPTCTFINKPTRPGCEMCSTDRPASYVVPGSYRPDETELWRMQREKEGILQYQQEKGRREGGPALPRAHGPSSLDDFIHVSSEFS